MTDPMRPSPSLLCKLGSIIVHADEFLEPGGHALDLVEFQQRLKDPEVIDWLQQMDGMAMLPRKRSQG